MPQKALKEQFIEGISVADLSTRVLDVLKLPKLQEKDKNVAISKSENSVGQDVHIHFLVQKWRIRLTADAYGLGGLIGLD